MKTKKRTDAGMIINSIGSLIVLMSAVFVVALTPTDANKTDCFLFNCLGLLIFISGLLSLGGMLLVIFNNKPTPVLKYGNYYKVVYYFSDKEINNNYACLHYLDEKGSLCVDIFDNVLFKSPGGPIIGENYIACHGTEEGEDLVLCLPDN